MSECSLPTYETVITALHDQGAFVWLARASLPDWFDVPSEIKISVLSAEQVLMLIKARNEGFIELHLSVDPEILWQGTTVWPEYDLSSPEELAKFIVSHQHSLQREVLHTLKLTAEQDFLPRLVAELRQFRHLKVADDDRILILDPGSRSGIKLLAANAAGDELCHSIVFPHEPQKQWQQGLRKLTQFCQSNRITKIILLSGEGFLESREFLMTWLKTQEHPLASYHLDESGLEILCRLMTDDIEDNLYLRARLASKLIINPYDCFTKVPLQSLLRQPLKTVINPLLLEVNLQQIWQTHREQDNPLVTEPLFENPVNNIAELPLNQALKGRVVNITDFGAFLDIGLKHNGLLHNSQIKQNSTLGVGDVLTVYVDKINLEKLQFSLKLSKNKPKQAPKARKNKPAANSAMADALQAAFKKQS